MAHRWLRKPNLLVGIPLLLLLVLAVACAEEATPAPAPTLDIAAIKAALQEVVGTAQPAVSAEEIGSMVETAVAGIAPSGVSADEIQALVQAAVAAAVPEGATAEEIRNMVETAVAAASTPGVTKEEVASLVSKAVTEAAAAGAQPLTEREIGAIVKAAQLPTPTPAATPTPQPTPTPFVEPKVDRLIIATAPPLHETNMPWRSSAVLFGTRPMYESLLDTDRSTGVFPIPLLAKRWTMGSDAKTWEFVLEEDVPFHFGWGEFTATDVVHMWERNTSPDSISSDARVWANLINSVDDFEIVNDHQIIFNLATAAPDMANELRRGSMLATSKKQWDQEGQEGFVRKPAGTGSWRYIERRVGEFIHVERVEDHWRIVPEFKEMMIRMVIEPATRAAMMVAEEAHMADLPKDLQDVAIAAGHQRVSASTAGTSWFYFMGGLYFVHPDDRLDLERPMTDIRVREAMNRAINREEIIDTIMQGRAQIAPQVWLHPSLQGWDDSWFGRFDDLYGYDPVRARELMEEADAVGFKLTIHNYPYGGAPELNQINEALALYFGEIGIDVTLNDTEYGTIRPDLRSSRFWGQLAGFPSFGSYAPHTIIRLMHHSTANSVAYESEYIDQKFEEIEQTVVPAERDRIQREMGEHLLVNYSIIPLFWSPQEVMIDPEVVAEYVLPGNLGDVWTHTEWIRAK